MPIGDTIGELGYNLQGEEKRYYKAGDTYPPLCASLKRSENQAIDMSDVFSITFSMRDFGNIYATPKVYNQPCTITNATNGKVCYYWGPDDLSSVGVYDAHFMVTYNATVFDGSTLGANITERFPSNQTLLVIVSESII